MNLVDKIKANIRDVKDFPREGVVFKDITPLLSNPELSNEILKALLVPWKNQKPDAVIGIDSRGFLYGMLLAYSLKIPFIPVRKSGKLPFRTFSQSYSLEYGAATMEMHYDALKKGDKVIVHDDLLATGGTANAAASLVKKAEARILGYSFLIELEFLEGRKNLENKADVYSLIRY